MRLDSWTISDFWRVFIFYIFTVVCFLLFFILKNLVGFSIRVKYCALHYIFNCLKLAAWSDKAGALVD